MSKDSIFQMPIDQKFQAILNKYPKQAINPD